MASNCFLNVTGIRMLHRGRVNRSIAHKSFRCLATKACVQAGLRFGSSWNIRLSSMLRSQVSEQNRGKTRRSAQVSIFELFCSLIAHIC